LVCIGGIVGGLFWFEVQETGRDFSSHITLLGQVLFYQDRLGSLLGGFLDQPGFAGIGIHEAPGDMVLQDVVPVEALAAVVAGVWSKAKIEGQRAAKGCQG